MSVITLHKVRERSTGRVTAREHTLLKVHEDMRSGSSRKRAAQPALPLITTRITCRAPLLRGHTKLLHGAAPQRVRILASGFELRTAPDLGRAEFGFVCRRTDGRRREPVQGRATDCRQKRNVRLSLHSTAVVFRVLGCTTNHESASATAQSARETPQTNRRLAMTPYRAGSSPKRRVYMQLV